MTLSLFQDVEYSVTSRRFAALLEKLDAVSLSLELIHPIDMGVVATLARVERIADATDVLRCAIADVRNIVCEANGLTARPEQIYG